MYESRIAADPLAVTMVAGFPPEIDLLAQRNLSHHGFLRAAWYRAGAADRGRTLVIRHGGAGDGGGVIAAIPTAPFGPAFGGARKVAGPYWPFRAPLIAADCSAFDLVLALEHPATRRLGPVWRIGPARMDDPATTLLVEAAQTAGWTILSRPAGSSWVVDLDAARATGWPRASTKKRLRRIERRLGTLGQVTWQHVRGHDWDDGVLTDLGAVEAASWVGTDTDGSGAKFLTAAQRSVWQAILHDPLLGDMLCATILRVDGRAVAFSFDCDDGPVRYGIVGSYMTKLGAYEIGKLANYRSMEDASAAGQRRLDLGIGDSGYKREMGAVEAYHMADLLFVRSRIAARLFAKMWGSAIAPGQSIRVLPDAQNHG